MSATKKSVLLACLIALGLVLGYIENMLHFLPLYGLKIGFSNLVVLFALYALDAKSACCVGMLKAVLNGFLFAGLVSIVYSSLGILAALFGMIIAKKSGFFSEIGVSMAGSCLFQAGQILAACLVLQSNAPLYYLPYLWLGAVGCGLLSGILVRVVLKRFLIAGDRYYE